MRSTRKAIVYGCLLWSVTLITSMVLFPVKRTWPVMFDSIMPVALSALTLLCLSLYLRRGEASLRVEGAWLGAIWLAINLLLDFPLFSFGPMKMSFADYFADIGLTYLIIPVITFGRRFSQR